MKAVGGAVAKSTQLSVTANWGTVIADERPQIGSPVDGASLLQVEMALPEHEQLRVVTLDTKHRIVGTRTDYQGSVNHSAMEITELSPLHGLSRPYGIGVPGAVPGAGSAPSCTRNW
jgi:DNA repair protein RadC